MRGNFFFALLLLAGLSAFFADAQRLLVPTDALSQATSWRLFHRTNPKQYIDYEDPLPYIFWAYGERDVFNATSTWNTYVDQGSICVAFTAFGVDEICRQIDGRFDAWGGLDQSFWTIGSGGNFVPGHQHVRADTLFTIVSGQCQFFTDYDRRRGRNEDALGMKWLHRTVVDGPGVFYVGRGTTFAWGCTPNTQLWFLNAEGGSTGGIPFALATQVFDPSGQFYSTDPLETRSAVVRVSELYNTQFLEDALDAVFGSP